MLGQIYVNGLPNDFSADINKLVHVPDLDKIINDDFSSQSSNYSSDSDGKVQISDDSENSIEFLRVYEETKKALDE